jgi:hypothetical protein
MDELLMLPRGSRKPVINTKVDILIHLTFLAGIPERMRQPPRLKRGDR